MSVPVHSSSLANTLSNACAGAITLAWHRKEKSHYSAFEELEYHVAELNSVAKVQRWFNASKLGLAPTMDLIDAVAACQLHPDEIWNQLVQLHPNWEDAASDVWNSFATTLVRYATDVRCLKRYDALLARARISSSTWDTAAEKASRLAAMEYLWDKGIRPLEAWVVNWFHARTSDRVKEPAVLARWIRWNHWMVENVLPDVAHFPEYTQLYRYVAKDRRLSINWARVARLESLMPYLPHIHLAAAWHNDPCWLSVRHYDNDAWRDYAYLYRLLHPQSFYTFAPELAGANLNAPLQDVWNMAYALNWNWATLLAQVERLGQKEGSLALPVDFAQ